LRPHAKVLIVWPMKEFQSALESVIGRLEEIRDGGGRWPRASRDVLALLRREISFPPSTDERKPIARRLALSKSEQLEEVRDRVRTCELCPHLAKSRTQTVFGVGNPDADLMFIGEAPGADEDRQGEPFVGRAGQLLTKIIETMGFRRDDVYIANILKSRPDMPPGAPGNRPPTPEEMTNCLPFLIEQIKIVQPKVMVALGATAVEGLLGFRGTMSRLRGQWHSFQDTPLMITYHPSYLLRNQSPAEKRKVWEDMLMILEKLERPISQKQRNYFR
jgi:DNA polymerase